MPVCLFFLLLDVFKLFFTFLLFLIKNYKTAQHFYLDNKPAPFIVFVCSLVFIMICVRLKSVQYASVVYNNYTLGGMCLWALFIYSLK